MALTLNDLRTTTVLQPPRFLIYGPPGLGKTTLACEWPNPILLDIEGGRPAGVSKEAVPGFDGDQLDSFDATMEVLAELYTGDHDFQTVILDTIDRFEPLVWKKACADNNWASIEAPGYGKGYVEADRYWRELLDGLNALRRDKGMAVVLVAHSVITRFDDPQAASYSRFDIGLHKRAVDLIQAEVDAVLFVNQDATVKQEDQGFNKKRSHAEGGGNRIVYCEGRPSFVAKNRFNLPQKFIYQPGQGFETIAAAMIPADAPHAEPKKEAA